MEVGEWASEMVEGRGAGPQGDVPEAKQCVKSVVGNTKIFAGPQQEKETQGKDLPGGKRHGCGLSMG